MAVIARVADHHSAYPRWVIDGPEGPNAHELPWNVERGGRSRKQISALADPHLTEWQVAEYAAQLPHHPELVRYLHSKGVSYKTARKYRFGVGKPLGYRSAGLVMPIRVGADWFYTYRLRQWPLRRPKEVPPRGHELAVWPWLPDGDAVAYLVESALAAACLRQRGFNAYAVHGASQYGLVRQVAERVEEVALLWDVGAEEMADNAVDVACESGAVAYRVPLGLDDKDGPDDWFTKHHRGVDELHTLIKKTRTK